MTIVVVFRSGRLVGLRNLTLQPAAYLVCNTDWEKPLLKVAYITMLFPSASETFATGDVRALVARGVDMSVHSLRPALRSTAGLAVEREVDGVLRTYNRGWRSLGRSVGVATMRLRVAVDLFAAIARLCASRPEHLVKSLILAPRVLEVFADLQAERPDVVHAFWSNYPSLVVYLVQRHMPGVVTSISFGAHDILERYGFSRPVASEADLVRTLARVNLNQVERGYGIPADAIEVVYNGVDLERLPPPVKRLPRSIVTAGRLVEDKGVDQVIRSIARLRSDWPDVTLRVLGDGPLLPQLRSLADHLGVADAVRFEGHVSHAELLQAMRRAEVLLFMSETEYDRLPNVVKEGMVCGCVCIVTNTDGIDELITHGASGFIVERGDVDAAVRHVDDVFAGRVLVEDVTREAEARIRRAFDRQVSVSRYQERWTELVARKRG